jgi:hypothetical protein
MSHTALSSAYANVDRKLEALETAWLEGTPDDSENLDPVALLRVADAIMDGIDALEIGAALLQHEAIQVIEARKGAAQ